MYNTAECPYCGHENDMTNALCDGLSNDNKLDWECEECEKEFEVYVEFEPLFSTSKIEYIDCENCGKKTRDIYEKHRVFPFPESLGDKRVCYSCFVKELSIELNKK